MKQYNDIKRRYPDACLLFRVGDFYETFGEDAIRASKILGIVLTKRGNGSEAETALAGFPHHSLNTYLPKLVKAGLRVAICDQLEDPKMTKTIVKRGVTELITPGVSLNDEVLQAKTNNFLAALHQGKRLWGLSLLDISTGEFLLAQGTSTQVSKWLQQFAPSEVLVQKQHKSEAIQLFGPAWNLYTLDDWVFKEAFARDKIQTQFEVHNLKGFGVEDLVEGLIAAGAILHYLTDTEHHKLDHLTQIQRIPEQAYVWMDPFTLRNLELVHRMDAQATTLLDIIDHTLTPMGGRLLKRWVLMPLIDRAAIEARLDWVGYLLENMEEAELFRTQLQQISDLERLISKVATGKISPKELWVLYHSVTAMRPLVQAAQASPLAAVQQWASGIDLCSSLCALLEQQLHPDAPVAVNKGSVIASGVHPELDELRALAHSGKTYLEAIEARESEATGIPSLKIAFNNVFGYYIEVRNTHKDKVPDHWIRKQTLVNAERYITDELKTYETKILGAEDRIQQLESQLFEALVRQLIPFIPAVQYNARALAEVDCLLAFARQAREAHYCRPQFTDDASLTIVQGRHPVIEKRLPAAVPYVANDVRLDREQQQIIMITGPNMSGKSALLRQTALIVLMAQMGSYVPATQVQLGLVDRIFTRVGASDNLSMGESTFMVEMNETASILNNLSERSLIILDEIGRGTSTYDGISIAWAIAEYLHEHPTRAKTLFATHYHELNEMAERFDRIVNFNVSVKETDNKVLFLRTLVPGGSAHSFGIHVAKMAGMPQLVVKKASKLLTQLENDAHGMGAVKTAKPATPDLQLSFFQMDDPVLEQVRDALNDIDINTLTPVEALMKLQEMQKLLKG